ncbi:hypothetical protein D2E26_1098 [Bifidobacterium dolichotidis]|uniref:Uncharacterized protein n=1 Tax=Bifidobacterium dolichotidis TaxID=2306976 RepID=A0A430FQG7_9BIFI|nr:hypothetical protein D2E26_1098 [Bifidobacterium dolichotidis]
MCLVAVVSAEVAEEAEVAGVAEVSGVAGSAGVAAFSDTAVGDAGSVPVVLEEVFAESLVMIFKLITSVRMRERKLNKQQNFVDFLRF